MQDEHQRTRVSALCSRTQALQDERVFLISEYVAGRRSREEVMEQIAQVAAAIGETAAEAVAVINADAWSLGTRISQWHDTLPRA